LGDAGETQFRNESQTDSYQNFGFKIEDGKQKTGLIAVLSNIKES
jgi:hypothetical protein